MGSSTACSRVFSPPCLISRSRSAKTLRMWPKRREFPARLRTMQYGQLEWVVAFWSIYSTVFISSKKTAPFAVFLISPPVCYIDQSSSPSTCQILTLSVLILCLQGIRLSNTICCVTMGLLWFGGNMLYGIGVDLVGDLGAVVGLPIFLSSMIVSSNIAAIFAGMCSKLFAVSPRKDL